MTLQQLRFLIAVAESGSINAAAQRLYTAQSNISNAVKSLEQELHLEIFTRSSRGVTLTNDGTELLGYARQVVEQADMLEARYEDGGTPQARLVRLQRRNALKYQRPPRHFRPALRLFGRGLRQRRRALPGRQVRVHHARDHHVADHR